MPHHRLTTLLAGLALVAAGCNEVDQRFDYDNDGFEDSSDCAPEDPAINPAAEDPYGDGVDSDCDGYDGIDRDGDGYPANPEESGEDYFDCNDANPNVHPGAEEIPDDGVDNDCSGDELLDEDGDGHSAGFDDCDDTDPTVFLGALELADCQDNDCNGVIDEGTATHDNDGDGYCVGLDLGQGLQCCDDSTPGDCDDSNDQLNPDDEDQDQYSSCGGDCDDNNSERNPGEAEVCDGQDNDCDLVLPLNEQDVDGDGFWPCTGDCDDNDPGATPADADNDGFSTCSDPADCDDGDANLSPVDADGDGSTLCDLDCDDNDAVLNTVDADNDGTTSCDGDCDDNDPLLNVDDNDNDGFDTCDGDCDDNDATLEIADADSDGYTTCGGDCDDNDATVHPDRDDPCDSVDNNCNGVVDEDGGEDADHDGLNICQGDCDDTDPAIWPGAAEICDGKDNDCDNALLPAEIDGDGDGWPACAGDCDDADVDRSPGAVELCNGLDDDCDGQLDDGCVTCDRTVPGDHGTIQGAFDAAAAGDVICVGPGWYVEAVLTNGEEFHLLGTAGAAATVIDGGAAGTTLSMSWGPLSPATVIEGLTLTGGRGEWGGGLDQWEDQNATIRDLIITGNETVMPSPAGGGIFIFDSDPTLERVLIEGNHSEMQGGGIFVDQGSNVTIRRAVLRGNTAEGSGGGVYATSQSTLTLESSVVEGNRISGDQYISGGGISISSASELIGRNVVIRNNHGNYGGGLDLSYGSLGTLTNAAIVGNYALEEGGGALVGPDSHLTLVNSLVAVNDCPGVAGGIDAYLGLLTLTNTVVTANENGGVFSDAWNDDVTSSSSNLWGNADYDYMGYVNPIGSDGNVSVDPQFTDTATGVARWDLHLDLASPMIDAGDPVLLDPDGGPSDIGPYGGPGGELWDLDRDGWYDWWQPGAWPGGNWDCDDRDGSVYPGSGC